ncbi:MAG: hypothetical protein ACHP7O_11405 [Burkholderiales bacterium]
MKLSCPSRFAMVCIALFSMLFMQLAIASCICDGMSMGGDSTSTFMSEHVEQVAMPGCEGMDMEQPSFCYAHALGDATKQSLDKYELPQIQPFVPAGFVLALPAIDTIIGTINTPHKSVLLTRTTAPPIAIRHCCFRI